jgi:hypothetical protein
MTVKGFMIQTPGPNFIKPFTSIIYGCVQYDRVLGRACQPGLMFIGKQGTYPVMDTRKFYKIWSWTLSYKTFCYVN